MFKKLKGGENVVKIEVSDANGNITVMNLTLYKAGLMEKAGFSWIYLVGGILAGLVVALVAFFSSKAKKPEKKDVENAFFCKNVFHSDCNAA